MEAIVSFISSVGFPIAACVAMYVMVNKTINNNTKAIEELRHTIERMNNNEGS